MVSARPPRNNPTTRTMCLRRAQTRTADFVFFPLCALSVSTRNRVTAEEKSSLLHGQRLILSVVQDGQELRRNLPAAAAAAG